MFGDDITVPRPVCMKQPTNFSCVDSPKPVLRIRYECILTVPHSSNTPLISLTNENSFTVPSCNFATIYFNVFVTTSLPAVTLIYGNDFLFRQSLTCVINPIPSNDTLLNVTVYNHKPTAVTFAKETLQFTCHTILAKYP